LRVRGDGRSARLFGWVVAWSLAMGLPQLFGRGWITPFVSGRAALIIGVTYFLVLLACDTYLIVWKIGASLGNARLSFIASFRVMHGNFWWSLLYIMVMSLPLMVVHYALNLLAVGRPPALIWAMLGADALTAGYLGIVLATTTYMIARRATARRGEPLLP
jgi:hypothetical protein